MPGLVRFTSRLRMKRLGLGEPISQAPISESAALEQASDFVQQLVLFSYSVGVFAGYYFYTKMTTPESLKIEDYEEFKQQQERVHFFSIFGKIEKEYKKHCFCRKKTQKKKEKMLFFEITRKCKKKTF